MNISAAETYQTLITRPWNSAGTESCSTVVPMGTMLPIPTRYNIAHDSQNQCDQAQAEEGYAEKEDAGQQQPVLMGRVAQRRHDERARQRPDARPVISNPAPPAPVSSTILENAGSNCA